MNTDRIVLCLLSVSVYFLVFGAPEAGGQGLRVEGGGGWEVPASTVTMTGTEGGQEVRAAIELGSGPHGYLAVGRVWQLSKKLLLEARLRGQQSRLRVEGRDFGNRRCGGKCRLLEGGDGRLWGATFEGRLALTSVGRIQPYFLVGMGVVHTVVDAVRVETTAGDEIPFSKVQVTDVGGDVGFGAAMPLSGTVQLTAETRVTGSLPGAKENAVTVFPFSLGLSYSF